MTSRGPYRRHSTPFKQRLCQDIRAGIIGRRDAQRSHNISVNLIQLWLTQFDRGEMITTQATVQNIAPSVGYENLSPFRRQFAAQFGITPAEIQLHQLSA